MAARGGVGAAPITEAMPRIETTQAAFKITSRRTPTNARYIGDARRGARALGSVSVLVCVGGVAAEILSTLQAVTGAQTAEKLNWPIAEGVWSWDQCEFLPNSDAPATIYGSGISVFYHSLNIIVLLGTITFLVRFVLRPRANYGMGTVGLLFWWLGLGLMSRWLGGVQLTVGAVMCFVGALDFWFGSDKFAEAFTKAITGAKPKEKEEAKGKDAATLADEKARQTGQDVTRLLQAYVPLNPIASGSGWRGAGFM